MVGFGGYICDVIIQRYGTSNPAIRLLDVEDGMPVAVATLNANGLELDEVAIKDYSENKGMYETLLENGIIHPKHREISTGHVTVPVCKLTEYYTL
jgi:hypothetical protein